LCENFCRYKDKEQQATGRIGTGREPVTGKMPVPQVSHLKDQHYRHLEKIGAMAGLAYPTVDVL
jgi:hypothetical protein